MTNINKFDEPAGILVKTTCVDFPGRVAGSFFLKGCNLRCPYCYNKNLVEPEEQKDTSSHQDFLQSLTSINKLFEYLEKRRGIISAFVISGGEPLLNPFTKDIIFKAKKLGYLVKLDTNGTLPEKLKEFLNNPEICPDFIAMDVKTSPSKYSELLCGKQNTHYKDQDYFNTVLQTSIKLISSLPCNRREFRTVLVPPLITKEDIKNIADYLPEDASWQFAQFQNTSCLEKKYSSIYPYSEPEIQNLIKYAASLIPGAALR